MSLDRFNLAIKVLSSLIPRLFPRANKKSKGKRREAGKIYHVRNVIGRENLITSG